MAQAIKKRNHSPGIRIAHYSREKLARQIAAIVGQYVDLSRYRIFFFGSRVSGRGDERSDIDVGIEGPRRIPVETLEKMNEAVSNLPMLYHVDIVDFKSADSRFRKVAKQHMEMISPPS